MLATLKEFSFVYFCFWGEGGRSSPFFGAVRSRADPARMGVDGMGGVASYPVAVRRAQVAVRRAVRRIPQKQSYARSYHCYFLRINCRPSTLLKPGPSFNKA